MYEKKSSEKGSLPFGSDTSNLILAEVFRSYSKQQEKKIVYFRLSYLLRWPSEAELGVNCCSCGNSVLRTAFF